jgi:hypothetical protein
VRLCVWIHVEKDPTNEVEDDEWQPRGREIAAHVASRVVGYETDMGYIITEVTT